MRQQKSSLTVIDALVSENNVAEQVCVKTRRASCTESNLELRFFLDWILILQMVSLKNTIAAMAVISVGC